MAPYVPPHLRGEPVPAPAPELRTVQRRKAIVIPELNGKYVVVRDKNSGQVTFIGGGCPFGKNIHECALKELYEESRAAINRFNFKLTERNNLRFIGNRSKEGVTNNRPGGFAENNRGKGIKVIMTYHVFKGIPKKDIKFNTIKQKFNAANVSKLGKNFQETSNIMVMSKNNLISMPAHSKYFIVNEILKRNLRRHPVNSRLVRPVFTKN